MSFLQDSIVYLWLLPVTIQIILPLAMFVPILVWKLFWPDPARKQEPGFEGEFADSVS
jgi:hypothetical protein